VKSFLTGVLLCLITASPAFAHGEHGNAAPPAGTSPVTIDGYQIELLTFPSPLVAGKPGQVVVKIMRSTTMEPVSGGAISIGFAPVDAPDTADAHSAHAAHGGMNHAASLTPVSEVTWAGSYTLESTPEKSGRYMARVAIAGLDGKSFASPLVVDFHFDVGSAAAVSPALLIAILTSVIVAFVGIGRGVARSRSVESDGSLDLLQVRWLDRFVRWRGFQPVFQIPVLLLTIVLAYLGFADIQDGAKNLATRLTWIIWWPSIIFTFILVGRFWCVMCPFGALNEWAAKWAKPKRMFPKPLRNLWLATFLFVLLTWFDEQLGIIRSPYMTASLIVLLTAIAVVTGLFYQRRSFCRYLCPITGLQGLYSMVSPIELRTKNKNLCQTECHQECYRGDERSDGCPMFEFPMTMERNTFCNFCFECVKSCPPGNVTLKTRGFGRELWSTGLRKLDESYLAVALVGITSVVSAQMLAPWNDWVSRLARYLPIDLRVLMRPVTYLALTESVVFFLLSLVLIPLLVLFAGWAAVRLSGDPERSVKQTFIALAGMFIPIGLAMHLAHNASHLLAEGAGVLPVLQRMLNRYTPFDFGTVDWQTNPIASAEAIHWLQMLLIIAGLGLSLAAYDRLASAWQKDREGARALIPFVAVALIFTIINLTLLNQPMAMRHGM
jgi:hypothetical protein